MLSGFNTNFRYRGVLFHVQTEDSGLGNPHVISHLFHGGNIMASEKRDYSDLIGEHAGSELDGAIRKVMEGQHKAMLKQLSRGEHDATIAQRMGPDVFRAEVSPGDAVDPPTVTEEERPPAPSAPPLTKHRIAHPPPRSLVEPTVIESPAGFSAAALASDGGSGLGPVPEDVHAAKSHEAPLATAAAPAPGATDSVSRLSRVFGARVVSEKPLDEVVLDYLVENARKRRRSAK